MKKPLCFTKKTVLQFTRNYQTVCSYKQEI